MRSLEERYAGRRDVVFLTVYQREPHAGQMAFEEIEQPTTYAGRCALARRAVRELGLRTTVLVDSMDDQSRVLFGDLPSPAIIVGPDGVIQCKLPWAEPDVLGPRIEKWLGETAAEPEGGASAPVRVRVARAIQRMFREGGGETRVAVERSLPELETAPDVAAWSLAALAVQRAGGGGDLVERARAAAQRAFGERPRHLAAVLASLVAHADAPQKEVLLADIARAGGDEVRPWIAAQR